MLLKLLRTYLAPCRKLIAGICLAHIIDNGVARGDTVYIVRIGALMLAISLLSFRYVPERALIEELSMTVEPGQTVAIVGPTGAGKTTLVSRP